MKSIVLTLAAMLTVAATTTSAEAQPGRGLARWYVVEQQVTPIGPNGRPAIDRTHWEERDRHLSRTQALLQARRLQGRIPYRDGRDRVVDVRVRTITAPVRGAESRPHPSDFRSKRFGRRNRSVRRRPLPARNARSPRRSPRRNPRVREFRNRR